MDPIWSYGVYDASWTSALVFCPKDSVDSFSMETGFAAKLQLAYIIRKSSFKVQSSASN